MKSVCKAICILLMFWLAFEPAWAAEPTKPAGRSSAKVNVLAKAKAKAKVRNKAKEKVTKRIRLGSFAKSHRKEPVDQASSEAKVAAAEKQRPSGWYAAQCLMDTSPDAEWSQVERAAQWGHMAAQEWMARRCLGEFGEKEQDFVCARLYLEQSARSGRPRAQTQMAYLLVSGQGGPVDPSRAALLYTAAAEQGDVDAQNNLGEIYEAGRGVARNPDEAIRWYERAAEQGLGPAQFNAGRLWAIGVGQKRDPAKARALLVQAEAKGIAQARQVLDWLDRQAALDEASVLKPATALGGGQTTGE